MRGLDSELRRHYEDGGYMPMIRHPLVYAVPFFETDSEIVRLNKMLASKKKQCITALANHAYSQYIFLHERSYRVAAFFEIRENLDDKDYWPLLREVWSDSENIYENAMQWWELLSSPRRQRNLFTSCEDRSAYKKLPAELSIFRGTHQRETDGSYLGYSWTLSVERAVWFATRLHRPSDGRPVIGTAKVPKNKIVGYIDSRGEQEIVVEPRELIGLDWEGADELSVQRRL